MKTRAFKEELQKCSVDALSAKAEELRRELMVLRINMLTAHVKDNSMFKKTRRDIARVMTCMRQKSMQG